MPEQLLSLLGTNLVDFLVYGAIALVVLVGVCKCIYPVFRNGSLLNRAVAKLEKTAGNNQRPSWREPRFLGRALRNEWQKFLLNAGQLDVRGMPCDIEDYINEDSVIDKPGHSQLAELIPSLLTSLGILGTFIGLMEGLTSVNFSDAQGTMDSIPAADRDALCLRHLRGGHYLLASVQYVLPHERGPGLPGAGQLRRSLL